MPPLAHDNERFERIRVLAVDDHPALREGIAAIINSQSDMVIAGQASGVTEAVQRYRECQPDVTLMDIRLPNGSGIDALMTIRAEYPNARIIMLTTFEGDVEMQRSLQAGARGYLLKSTPNSELVDAIRQVHAGKKCVPPEVAAELAEHITDEKLTARECEVLQSLAAGYRNREVARRLLFPRKLLRRICAIFWRSLEPETVPRQF
jgi:DNA-binding NarL/FixJ family response regulator